jgi:hypothetical protein
MANSVFRDKQGPDFPLGLIVVPTPGTPAELMSLVDATDANEPESATSTTSDEYTIRAQQIIFQAYKAGAAHGLVPNTGNIYIVREAGTAGGGSANRDDYGAIVAVLTPGQTFTLGSAALNRNVYSPYRYRIDADNAGDSCNVTLIIQ